MIQNTKNKDGQKQIIESFDRIIKIGNKYLELRLIKTQKWKAKMQDRDEFTCNMPRARFVNPVAAGISYIVDRDKLLELKNDRDKLLELKNKKSESEE